MLQLHTYIYTHYMVVLLSDSVGELQPLVALKAPMMFSME